MGEHKRDHNYQLIVSDLFDSFDWVDESRLIEIFELSCLYTDIVTP